MILAQAVVTTEWLAPLTNLGVAGYMIYFLTTRGEQGLRNLAAAITEAVKSSNSEISKMRGAMDRATKTQLMSLLTHPSFPSEARQPAKTMLEEIEQAEK